MVTLTEALLQVAVVKDVHFKGEDVCEAVVDGVKFEDCRFSDCKFIDGARQTGTVWKYCNLAEAQFTDCNLGMNKLEKCEAYLLQFLDCAAAGIQIEVEVHRQISQQLMMGGMVMDGCKMQYAVFTAGNYAESRFEKCDLRDCSFAGSNLSEVSLRESQLENTDFTGATLDGADLAGAAFERFDLSVIASYRGMVISQGQHEAILVSLGLVTLK